MSEKKKQEIDVVETQKAETSVIHVVKKGDTIRSIAQKYLGSTSRACEIRMKNKLVTDILPVGKKLVIPKK